MKKFKKEKGFTLIELLAVIVILAVIALIATPIIIGIIEDAKEQANRRSIDGLVKASSLYLAQSELDSSKKDKIQQEENILLDLSVSGNVPSTGQFYQKEDGRVSFALKYDKKCYRKEYDGEMVSIPYTVETCRLNIHINNPTVTLTVDDVFNSEGWSKENFYVHINTTDHSGLGTSIEWCGTDKDTCVPTAEIKDSEGHISFSEETIGKKICARAMDGFENSSEVICSDYYKLDKTVPNFTGIGDIVVTKDTVVDVRNGVVVTDNFDTSITYTVSPERVDTTKAGEIVLTYTATDKAGNTKTGIRTVTVKQSTLKDTIINNGTVTAGNGLYKISGTEYKYRGGCTIQGSENNYTCGDADPIHNYIKLGTYLYRIIGMDAKGIKVIRATKLENRAFDPDDTNIFDISNSNTNNVGYYLNKNTSVAEEIKYLRTISSTVIWNVGDVNAGANRSLATVKAEEKKKTSTFQIGLMNISDYVEGSINSICQIDAVNDGSNAGVCRNNNWLFNKDDNNPWTINPYAGYSLNVWLVLAHNGNLSSHNASFGLGIRPVAYLSNETLYSNGDGTKENPYIIS